MEILELLKWPLVTLLLGGVAIVVFKPILREQLSRVKLFKWKDGTLSTEQQAAVLEQRQEAAIASSPGSLVPQASPFELDSPYLKSRADIIAERVRAMHFATESERERYLYREQARATVALEYEQIYRMIWGSQMSVLWTANQIAGCLTLQARSFYDAAAQAAPAMFQNYSFERWLGWLSGPNVELAQLDGDTIKVTERGALFLQWVVVARCDPRGMRPEF